MTFVSHKPELHRLHRELKDLGSAAQQWNSKAYALQRVWLPRHTGVGWNSIGGHRQARINRCPEGVPHHTVGAHKV